MKLAGVWAVLLLALLTVSSADAQTFRTTSQDVLDHRIVVVGHGVAHVHADILHLQLRFFARQGSANVDDAGRKIAEIMRSNGVPDAQWTLPLIGILSPSSQLAIVGSMRKPTREVVESMARRIAAAIPDSVAGAFQNANLLMNLALDDCGAAQAQAEAAAIADARRKAAHLAAYSGLKLGDIVGVGESNTFLPACGDVAGQQVNIDGQNALYGPLDVTVSENENVMFATR
jgi:hypothetical protein